MVVSSLVVFGVLGMPFKKAFKGVVPLSPRP